MKTPTVLPKFDAPGIPVRDVLLWLLCVLALGVALGFCWGVARVQEVRVPVEALKQAREAVNKDMSAACSNWFTDKRTKQMPGERIVVCRAPDFLQ